MLVADFVGGPDLAVGKIGVDILDEGAVRHGGRFSKGKVFCICHT
jgi:hypothetical protein